MTVALQLDAVSASYPGRWLRRGAPVLQDVALRVDPGERIAVIGPSGGGKSTLARVATGLLRPSTGTVRIRGEDTTGWSRRRWLQARHHVQLLPQDPAALLIPQVPIALALAESARLHGTPTERIPTLAEDLGIAHRLDAAPEALSGGELRRAGLARVLLARPTLLVADEPTAGLDRPLAVRLLELLTRHLGPTCAILLISHDPRLIRRWAHRFAVIADGRLVEEVRGADAPATTIGRDLLDPGVAPS